MADIRFSDDLERRLEEKLFAKEWVRSRYEQMNRYRDGYKRTWQKAYKYYRSVPEPKESRWKARLFIPRTFETIHTILPRLVQGIFGERPAFSLEPMPDSTAFLFEEEQLRLTQRAYEAERVVQMQLERQINLKKVAQTNWFLSALIYGGAPAIVGWDQQRKTITFSPIDVYDFWFDPRCEQIQEAEDAMHEVRVPIDLIRQRAQEGVYDQEAVSKIKPEGEADWPSLERLKTLTYGYTGPSGEDRTVTLREYWRRSRVITVVKSSGEVLRNEKNTLTGGKFLPYVFIKNIPVPGELYGMGVPEILETLQMELNENRNLWLDNKKLAMCRMFAVSHEVNDEILVAAPGAVFKVSDPQGGIRPIEIPDLGQSSTDAETFINNDIDRTMGIYDYTRGKAGKANETATGIQLIQTEANVRFAYVLSLFEDGCLDLVQKILAINAEWMELPAFVFTTGGEGRKFEFVSEDVFDTTYNVAPVASATIGNRDMQRRAVVELIELAQRVPQFAEITDWRRMYNHLIQKSHMRDVAGIVKDERRVLTEQLQQAQQQEMMAQQQLANVQKMPMPGAGMRGMPGVGGVPVPLPGPTGEMQGRPAEMQLT